MSSSFRSPALFTALFLVPGGLGILALLAAGRPAQAPVDAGIRFVDMHKVMVESKFFNDKAEGIKTFLTQREKEMQALSEQFNKKRNELREMEPGTALAEQTGLELSQLKDKMEFLSKTTKSRVRRDENQLEVAVYQMVRRTVAAYAQNKGLQAVYLVDEERLRELVRQGRKGRASLIRESNNLRGVLWHNPALEVTDDIIKLINQG